MKVPKPCRYCMNHPINCGSGICHCILGSPIIYAKENYNQTWDDEDDVVCGEVVAWMEFPKPCKEK